MKERSCVVCRKKNVVSSFIRFALEDSRLFLLHTSGSHGRGLYIHPKCFGSKKLFTSVGYHLAKCKRVAIEDKVSGKPGLERLGYEVLTDSIGSFLSSIREVYLELDGRNKVESETARISHRQLSNHCLAVREKLEEALASATKNTSSWTKRSQILNNNKGNQAKRKIRL